MTHPINWLCPGPRWGAYTALRRPQMNLGAASRQGGKASQKRWVDRERGVNGKKEVEGKIAKKGGRNAGKGRGMKRGNKTMGKRACTNCP